MPGRLLRVGLTGGIASGKSHVLARLAAAGLATVDLDRVAHRLLARGAAGYDPVVAAFGRGILDPAGEIDRKALGAVVFASPEARARLDGIVHPLVRAEEASIARAAEDEGARVLVTDAALLVEAGLHLRFDRLVVAWCPPEVQLARLRARDGIGEEPARQRLRAQMPADEKREYAHLVVDTSGSLEHSGRQADALASTLLALRVPAGSAAALTHAARVVERGPAGPRPLAPSRLLSEFEAAGGFDMARLARALEPPAEGAWYRAAQALPPGPGPEALGPVIALCCAARGADADFLLGAAFSLARLTHAAADAHAAGCLGALASWAVLGRGSVGVLDEAALAGWSEQARARAGAAPPDGVQDEIRGAAGAPAPGTLGAAIAALAGPD